MDVPFSTTLPSLLMSSGGALWFARNFPFVLWNEGAKKYYVPAFYTYDDEFTFFDNTPWTYATDYIIAAFMMMLALSCCSCVSEYHGNIRVISVGLLSCYCISVLAGGFAHQNYISVEDLNTPTFRLIWIICVGTVTSAGGIIGAIGTEIGRSMGKRCGMPIFPHYFWVGFSLFLTMVCAAGGISYKRPACDIFIAGTTQTFPTFYSILMVLNVPSSLSNFHATFQMSPSHKNTFIIAFLLNAPLLPAYPILLSYGLQLGTVNFTLHCTLFVAWGLQGLTLMKLMGALQRAKINQKVMKQ